MGSDNGLLPGQWQSIIWTTAGILLIRPLGINFCEILIKINNENVCKMASISSQLQCVKIEEITSTHYQMDLICWYFMLLTLEHCVIRKISVFSSSFHVPHFNGLVQDCSNSSALAMELLQSRPLIWFSFMTALLWQTGQGQRYNGSRSKWHWILGNCMCPRGNGHRCYSLKF